MPLLCVAFIDRLYVPASRAVLLRAHQQTVTPLQQVCVRRMSEEKKEKGAGGGGGGGTFETLEVTRPGRVGRSRGAEQTFQEQRHEQSHVEVVQ